MNKYILEGLDCASCALKLEEAIRKLPGVHSATIQFATQTMSLSADSIEPVLKIIKTLEPDIEVSPVEKKKKSKNKNIYKKELILIAAVIPVYIAGLVFQDVLSKTPFSFAEYALFLSIYALTGWKVIRNAVRNIIHGNVFDENFLMTLSTTGAIFIHALPEAAGVMVFYQIGEIFQNMAVNRSRKSIQSLLEVRPEKAHVIRNGKLETLHPSKIEIGETLVIKPGEKVPLDGTVIDGTSNLDTAMLTGEFRPQQVQVGDMVLAGTINQTGALTIRADRLFENSSIAKILLLVESASEKKAKTERFITVFARYYTPAIVALSAIVAIIPPLAAGAAWGTWIYRALVILVISCPCALVISIPLGYFGGIGGAARKGILVKGSAGLDALCAVKNVVFDKTGTLTEGVFEVTELHPEKGVDAEELLLMAAEAEIHSSHPIAESIKKSYGKPLDPALVTDYKIIPGYGVSAVIRNKKILIGNDKLLHLENIDHSLCCMNGTIVHAVMDGVYIGYLKISDRIRDDSFEAVLELKKAGIKSIKMLTGDSMEAAEIVSSALKLNGYKADLLPEEKLTILEEWIKAEKSGDKTAFVGDGVNDSPVIARADVGIAMGKFGSAAAVDTADVVLMSDHPSRVAEAIRISRKTRTIVWQNIILAMGIKLAFVSLGIFGLASMWEAVFADMGVALLAILNASRTLKA